MCAFGQTRPTLLLIGGIAFAVAGIAAAIHWETSETSAGQPQPPVVLASAQAQPRSEAQPAGDDRAGDRAAIQKTLDGLATAFQKGDGKAVAAFWTGEGEYTSEDGATFTGRAALEKAYTEFFAKNPENALEVEVDSLRFPSRDTAVVEGHFKLRQGKKKDLVVSRCSLLYTREDGKWLIAIAKEWPGDGLSVRDLEWLIGSWEAKRDGMTATTRYEWTKNKTFIRCQFSITQDGRTVTGMQMFGKDPATGLLRVWTFEDGGGIGDAEATRDEKKWTFAAHGTTAEGDSIGATNIMTPLDENSFLWQSVERSMNDEPLPDQPPIKVTRVKSK
jgi:uncharacterized protein (TIGR02246 family)